MSATAQHRLNVLLLGGTSEAARLARHLADQQTIRATLSLAGRTTEPPPSPLPVRRGGFGGVEGLARYLKDKRIGLVIDATHPFAAQMSTNAVLACSETNVSLIALERPSWKKLSGDNWHEHATVSAAVAALPTIPHRIFSALGRSAVPQLATRPEHHYVIRVVDPLTLPSELSTATMIAARGPFNAGDDAALFRDHRIDMVLAKNAGGDAAYAKIEAARRLGLPVHMVLRPSRPERETIATVEDAMNRIHAHYSPLTHLGV